jgi:hypothetical protein
MKKFSLIGILTFLILFVHFYRTFRKFRPSIIAAAVGITVYSSILTPASARTGEVDGFTPKTPLHRNNPKSDRSVFGPKSNSDGSGPGKPGDEPDDQPGNEIPNYPKTESVKKTGERLDDINEHLARMKELSDSDEEACNEYKVYSKISSTLSKVSYKIRKDKQTSKSLDKLTEELKDGQFHSGRGAKKLAGTKTVYYMRAGNQGRLFFRYSEEEKGAIEIIGESNKPKEQEVIDNLKQNYK